nr:spidroin-1-like [Aegilops tauschii subsp. strangulata]
MSRAAAGVDLQREAEASTGVAREGAGSSGRRQAREAAVDGRRGKQQSRVARAPRGSGEVGQWPSADAGAGRSQVAGGEGRKARAGARGGGCGHTGRGEQAATDARGQRARCVWWREERDGRGARSRRDAGKEAAAPGQQQLLGARARVRFGAGRRGQEQGGHGWASQRGLRWGDERAQCAWREQGGRGDSGTTRARSICRGRRGKEDGASLWASGIGRGAWGGDGDVGEAVTRCRPARRRRRQSGGEAPGAGVERRGRRFDADPDRIGLLARFILQLPIPKRRIGLWRLNSYKKTV